MRRPRAGIDLDGVVYQWSPTARRLLREEFGLEVSESQTYNWIKDELTWMGREDAWRWLWDTAVTQMFGFGEPYPGAISAVQRVARDHDVVIITKRPRGAIGATLGWLAEYGVPASEVVILHESGAAKSDVQCDWYVDDSAAVVEELWRAGRRVYVMNRPWNRPAAEQFAGVTRRPLLDFLSDEAEAGVERVRDWDHLLVKVGA